MYLIQHNPTSQQKFGGSKHSLNRLWLGLSGQHLHWAWWPRWLHWRHVPGLAKKKRPCGGVCVLKIPWFVVESLLLQNRFFFLIFGMHGGMLPMCEKNWVKATSGATDVSLTITKAGFFLMNWPVQGINHSHPRWPAGRGPSHWRILLMRLMVSRLWHFLMFGRFLFFHPKKRYFDAKFKCSCPRVLFTVGTLDCVKCLKAFGRWIIRRARAPWRLTSFCMFLWRTNFFTKIWGMVVLKLVKKDRFLDSLFVCVKWVIWIYPRLMPSWQMKV